jgi:PIN domain nuclease of toxin-antitoxin system
LVERVAPVIYLDTHVVAWLYALGAGALSSRAAEAIGKSHDLRVSPVVRLELQYLFEIERVAEPAAKVVDSLAGRLGMTVCSASFASVLLEAERMTWTRDPFDRLIVAQAALHRAPLLTKDSTLHEHYSEAVW